MKLRLTIAITLIALSVGMAVFCMLRLNRVTDELSAAIETAMAAAALESPDWQSATDEVMRLWERDQGFMHILLPHVNLNELEWTLGALPLYLQQRDKALYIEQCVRGLQCVKTVREMERPTLGNVF